MNIFFRILLAVYAFCLAVFSVIAMLVTLKVEALRLLYRSLDQFVFSNSDPVPRIVVFLIALVFFVLSIMFLFSGVRNNKDKNAVSKHTNIGEIKISLGSIENIALNATRKASGVKDTKTIVSKKDDSVSITVKMSVQPDISIPLISEDVQDRVKKAVEDSTGINVIDVKVLVEGISASAAVKTRVE